MTGLGTDIVAVARIGDLVAGHGDRFLNRCFRPREIRLARERGPRGNEVLASRWAAKEAFIKAMGSRASGIVYNDVEVVRQDNGAPVLLLHGSAERAFNAAGGGRIMLSLSHEDAYAVAVVMIQPDD
jgi:holo-[acyl-carrier protein] synthase